MHTHTNLRLATQALSLAAMTMPAMSQHVTPNFLTALAPQWYLETNPDVARAAGATRNAQGEMKLTPDQVRFAIRHYMDSGRYEGRAPSVFFNPSYYLSSYADLSRVAPVNPRERMAWALQHWIHSGAAEGRKGSPFFDAKYYANAYADLSRVFGTNYAKLAEHYAESGLYEGRVPSSEMASVVRIARDSFSFSERNNEQRLEAMKEAARAPASDIRDSCNEGTIKAGFDLLKTVGTCASDLRTGSFPGPACEVGMINAQDSLQAVGDCGKAVFDIFIEQLKQAAERVKNQSTEDRERGRHEADRQNAAGERYEARERSGRRYA